MTLHTALILPKISGQSDKTKARPAVAGRAMEVCFPGCLFRGRGIRPPAQARVPVCTVKANREEQVRELMEA